MGEQALSGLTDVNSSTVGVALAAGVAGVLALETRASAAVGVGISITTIPAAAYLGVAAGNGQIEKVWGAAAVLGVNVLMLLIADPRRCWSSAGWRGETLRSPLLGEVCESTRDEGSASVSPRKAKADEPLEIDVRELSGLFAAPGWLRDIGPDRLAPRRRHAASRRRGMASRRSPTRSSRR